MEWLEHLERLAPLVGGAGTAAFFMWEFFTSRRLKNEKTRLELIKLRLEAWELANRLDHPFDLTTPATRITDESRDESAENDEALRMVEAAHSAGEDPMIESYRRAPVLQLILGCLLVGVGSWVLGYLSIIIWDFSTQQVLTWPLAFLAFILGAFAFMGVLQTLIVVMVLIERAGKFIKSCFEKPTPDGTDTD